MAITSLNQPDNSLFHSVDRSYDGRGVVFQFVPESEQQALYIVGALLPFLRQIQGNEVEKYFTPDAIDIHKESTWDVENYQLISADDKMMDMLLTEDEEYNLTDGNLDIDNGLNPPAFPTNIIQHTLFGADDPTVSTLASRTSRTTHTSSPFTTESDNTRL